MHYIYFFISYLLGMFTFSLTVIVVLTIFAFGIPTTKRLVRLGLMKTNNMIIPRYMASLIVLLGIFVVTSAAVYYFFPSQFIGYLIGCGFSFVLGIGQIGTNKNNVMDYVQANENSFLGDPDEIIGAILQNR